MIPGAVGNGEGAAKQLVPHGVVVVSQDKSLAIFVFPFLFSFFAWKTKHCHFLNALLV